MGAQMRTAWTLILSMMVFSACGSQSPLDIVGDPSFVPRSISLPLTTISSATAYTSTSQSVTLGVGAGSFSIVAPYAGVIDTIAGTVGNYSVTILHNGRLTTRITGIQQITV